MSAAAPSPTKQRSLDNLLQCLRILLARDPSWNDRHNVRETCRAFRDVCDQMVRRIRLYRLHGAKVPRIPPSVDEIAATIQRASARGCRPSEAWIAHPLEHLAVIEETALAFLSSLKSAAAPIEFIRVGKETPLTAPIARAIAGVSPQLSRLHIRWSSPENSKQPAQETSSVSTACQLLLQLVGPQLRSLELHIFDEPWPINALGALTFCTALTGLELHNDWYHINQEEGLSEETSLLQLLSSLTSLRDLSLSGGARPEGDWTVRAVRAANLESCLSRLTALTRLDIRLHCLQHVPHPCLYEIESDELAVEEQLNELKADGRNDEAEQLRAAVAGEWRALAAAARCMPHLAVLRTHARADVSDLAALTALTYLRAGALLEPASGSQEVAAGRASAPAVYYLPPLLKRLVVFAPLPVQVAHSLRRSTPASAFPQSNSPPAISWEAPGLMLYDQQPYWRLAFTEHDAGQVERLVSPAAAMMHSMAASLKTIFKFERLPPSMRCCEVGPYLFIGYTGPGHLLPPAEPDPSAMPPDDTHIGSWLGAVLTELRPLSLRLWGLGLTPRDFLGVARCLREVQVLDLCYCSYNLAALPLLGSLSSLKVLKLRADDWEWPQDLETGYEKDVVEGTFLTLTVPAARFPASSDQPGKGASYDDLYSCPAALPLPKLEELTVSCESEDIGVWLGGRLAPARAELAKRPSKARLIHHG